jgi:hypothetical protein
MPIEAQPKHRFDRYFGFRLAKGPSRLDETDISAGSWREARPRAPLVPTLDRYFGPFPPDRPSGHV